jgi:hypothetical protein
VRRAEELKPGGLVRALVSAALARPRLVSLIGALATLAMAATALALRPDNRISEATPASFESMQALAHCDRAFGGVTPAWVLAEWEEGLDVGSTAVRGAIGGAAELVRAEELASAPLAPYDLLYLFGPDAPTARFGLLPADVVGRLLRADLRRAVVAFRVQDAGAERLDGTYARLRAGLAELEREHPGVRLHLTGTGVVARENINSIIRDLARGLALASVVILAVLSLAVRSLRLGLIAVLPNLLPLAAISAWLWIGGRHLDVTSAVAFTVCLGIAVDDTVHVLSRFRRELLRGGSVREVVERSVLAVAPALFVTTAVFVAGFGVLLLSPFPNLRLFGELSAIGFAAALAGDLVLLPALLVVLGKARA